MSTSQATVASFSTTEVQPVAAVRSVRRLTVAGAAVLTALVIGSFIGGGAEGYAIAGCRIEPTLPRHGIEAETTMQVARGTSCAIWLKPTNISVDDLAITQAPSNGVLRMRGRTGVTYLPAKAFTGDDSFAFEVLGHVGAERKATTVRVRVYVK